MRNFDPSCRGTIDETQQVAENRKLFKILRSTVGVPSVTVSFGDNFCPIPGRVQRGDACSVTPVFWDSTYLPDGSRDTVAGDDWIAAYYRSQLKAWKLCDSQFIGRKVGAFTQFIR